MTAHNIPDRTRFLTPDVAFNPYAALTSYERAEAENGYAVAEGLLKAYDAVAAFLRQYVATPVVRLYLRSRLVEELSHLSERSLHDIGMSRREIAAAARKAYPLFERGTEKGLPVTDVRTVATAARKAAPANDDGNRRAA
jgi:uncharacterized protein YjiS (DUF1127 family)